MSFMFGITVLQTSFWEVGLRFLLTLGFAGLLGWERERHGRPAGLRTHMMVALGAAAFTVIAIEWFEALKDEDASAVARAQVLRIIAAVVGGVGFLGAGAIIRSGGRVHGLTTAAGLWVAAAVGVATGGGHYAIAAILTGFAFLTLSVLQRAASWINPTARDEPAGNGSTRPASRTSRCGAGTGASAGRSAGRSTRSR
jgi:putative Mg2+ transporter-C (MgtC) family protein